MSVYFAAGSPTAELSSDDLRSGLSQALGAIGKRRKVLVVPPDITRYHSRAGELTRYVWQHYGSGVHAILPAIGTHSPMTPDEIRTMFGDMPQALFLVHDWYEGCATLGVVPADFVREKSDGLADFSWPAQVAKPLVNADVDLILSIGQVVPHEVSGMANYNKNILVGVGCAEGIHKSHFLSALYGIERIMGRMDNPVRSVFDYASEHFGSGLPVVYVLTVVGTDYRRRSVVRGLFIGDDRECFEKAARLSLEVNFRVVDREISKAVVFLDPLEFKSTWLGNKAVYRTRMAMADGGELIILAPGVRQFGEDRVMDTLIREYGYAGTRRVLEAVERDPELQANLAVAAHLIQGSSEGRFTITYCPGYLSREEIEGVHFRYGGLERMTGRYDPSRLVEGFNKVGDEEVFFISNPALGLWTHTRF